MTTWIKPRRWWKAKNFWIALVLLAANGWAWLRVAATADLPAVAAIIHPGVDDIRRKWNSGEAVGETFAVTVTDLEAAQTIAWFLAPRENIPFSRPQIEFKAGEVTGRGIMTLGGLRVLVYGRGAIDIQDGRPAISVHDVGVGNANVPDFVQTALQSQVDRAQALYEELDLPIELTRIEIRDGEATVEGVYR